MRCLISHVILLQHTYRSNTLNTLISILDAEEEKKKEELRQIAKRELEEWYRHHNELIVKTKQANRYVQNIYVY